MGRAHEIKIASETGAFEKGIKSGVVEPLEDVTEALKVLEKASGQSTDDLERELEKAGDKSRDLRKEINKTADAIEQDFKKGYRSAADSADDGFRRMGDAGTEVSGELKQNLGETFSSFRGDLEDLPQIAQDVFGGLAGSVGGLAGSLALAAGAAGIGLLIAGFQAVEEERKKLQERAADLANAYIESGTEVVNALTIASKSAEILTDDEQKGKLDRLTQALGDRSLAARALAGDTNAVALATKLAAEGEDEYRSLATRSADYLNSNLTPAESARYEQLQILNAEVRELNGVQADASEIFRTHQGVLQGLINDSASATKEVDELGNELYTLPDGEQILIDAKTGQARTDVSTFKGDLDGIPETITSKVKVQLDDSAVRNYRPPTINIPGRIVPRGTVQYTG